MGMARVPEATRTRHTEYLKSVQRPDGGFAGRLGDSDLYYTSFALRSLAILGELYGECAQRAADFLQPHRHPDAVLVDQISLVFGAAQLEVAAGIEVLGPGCEVWIQRLTGALTGLRRDDGGFAKGAEGRASSTYHTFLTLLCLQLLEQPVAQPERIVHFIRSQHDQWGGFREIRVAKRAGTNPTAAAIGVLRMLDALTPDERETTAGFLAELQSREEGGLLANTRIPVADLLSTFTGLLTLVDLGAGGAIDRAAALRFVQGLEQPGGGFRAAAWDEGPDVEYTFYGLGAWALLSATEA